MNFPVPSFIQDAEQNEDVIEGTLELNTGTLEAIFDSEIENPTAEDFREVFSNVENFRKIFDRRIADFWASRLVFSKKP